MSPLSRFQRPHRRVLRMLQHQGALQVFVRVQAAGEAEMPLEVGSGIAERLHYRIGWGGYGR